MRLTLKNLQTAALAALLLAPPAFDAARAEPGDVGPNTNPTYVKECGSCHFPYQPAFLPARSWQKIMGSLKEHFGENAEVKLADRDNMLAYLAGAAADSAANGRSRTLMSRLPTMDTPMRVTDILLVGGIHGGFLDPKFKGIPAMKSLADCAACHPRALDGRFGPRNYTVTDETFRVLKGGYEVR